MATHGSDTIVVQATLTRADYARYFDIVGRRQSDWTSTAICAGAFFAAVPCALIFRRLSQAWTEDPADADLIGKLTLLAFLLGAAATVIALVVIRRRFIVQSIDGTLNAFGPKTATFDTEGVTLTGQIAESMWRWPAVSELTIAQDLLLIWVGTSVVMIVPTRHFGSDAARDAAIGFIRERLKIAANS